MPQPEVLTKCTETSPASASILAQAPIRPRWPLLRMPINASPCVRARPIASAIASAPITWP
jgi:hypothetical protein